MPLARQSSGITRVTNWVVTLIRGKIARRVITVEKLLLELWKPALGDAVSCLSLNLRIIQVGFRPRGHLKSAKRRLPKTKLRAFCALRYNARGVEGFT
jgi:hypothetical protein